MIRPTERHGDHDGFRGHRVSRIMRGTVPPLLVLFFVLMIMVLKVPPGTTGTVPCDCETCHIDPHAGGFTGCTSCHAAPPATGSHRVHFDNNAPLDGLRYGDTTLRSTADAYIFDCGNCHPLDSAKHMNGTVDVELYNPSAPAESLKAKNTASAAYDPVGRTCSNVYCHSGYTVASGAVGLPLTSPPNPVPPGYSLSGTYIMDPTGNLTYDPYTVTITKNYRVTPAWGTTGTFTTCTECHGFPTTTSFPQVQAMVGDTHGWLDDYGYYDGHMYNMGFGGVPCATCHNTSVNHYGNYPTDPPGVWGPMDIYIYNAVTIKNRSLHVNGSSNVAFDTVYGYRYYSPYYGTNEQKDLTSATYDAPTKTCGNVSCHINQTTVKWGSPYRYWNSAECNICHGM